MRISGNAVVCDMRKNGYGGFVCPEIVVGYALRYLAGGKYTDLGDIFGLGKSEVYNCRNDFLTAVLEYKEGSQRMRMNGNVFVLDLRTVQLLLFMMGGAVVHWMDSSSQQINCPGRRPWGIQKHSFPGTI